MITTRASRGQKRPGSTAGVVARDGVPPLAIPTNMWSAEILLRDPEGVSHFARIASERVTHTLALLAKLADDGQLQIALEGVADLAYQVQEAVALLTATKGGAA